MTPNIIFKYLIMRVEFVYDFNKLTFSKYCFLMQIQLIIQIELRLHAPKE